MTTSMTLFCQLLALGRAPNKDRDRSIRSQLNSRCQLVSLLSLFIAIYIAKTKALLPTVWSVPKCLLQFSQFDNRYVLQNDSGRFVMHCSLRNITRGFSSVICSAHWTGQGPLVHSNVSKMYSGNIM